MIPPWLQALQSLDRPAVLVTVAMAEGSVPRAAGARMVVTADAGFDTIGGGHLEYKACEHARALLQALTPVPPGVTAPTAATAAEAPTGQANTLATQAGFSGTRLQRFPLGPTLGQCCGGAVTLGFELIRPQACGEFQLLAQRLGAGLPSWRLAPLDDETMHQQDGESKRQAGGALLCDGDGRALGVGAAVDSGEQKTSWPQLAGQAGCHIVTDAGQRRWLADRLAPFAARLYLFGAGHVGAALVGVLASLPCRITWVDEREALRPAQLPANAIFEATDTPEALIAGAPAGASFLVMTHSHALDQLLAEHILRRGDFGWFGLIGSRTKRVQFERRLLGRGIDAAVLARMQCPIGLPGISGKEPAVIAVAVAAQLLMAWQNLQAQGGTKREAMPETRAATAPSSAGNAMTLAATGAGKRTGTA